MPLTTADANNLLSTRFGQGASNVPSSYWAGLSSTQPGADGSGASEPSGGGYAPVEIPNDAAHWTTPVGRSTGNAQPITFPAATAGWGVLGWYLLKDAANGAVRAWGPLASTKDVTAGAVPTLAAGAVLISAPAV